MSPGAGPPTAGWARRARDRSRLDVFEADATTAMATGEGAEAVLNLATHTPGGSGALRRRAWEIHDRLRRDACSRSGGSLRDWVRGAR